MAKSGRICVVGSANVDLTFRTPRLPRAGETLAGHALHIGMGGKGANQAVAAARLGADVAFVACVGNDAFGADAIRQYQAEGIDTSFVRRDANRPTGTAAIVVDDEAENSIIIVAGANADLTPEDVTERVLRHSASRCRAVPARNTARCDAGGVPHRTCRRQADRADTGPGRPSCPMNLLRLCDVCVLNRTEMEFLAKCSVDSPDDAHAAARSLGRSA